MKQKHFLLLGEWSCRWTRCKQLRRDTLINRFNTNTMITNPDVWFHRCSDPSRTVDVCESPTWNLEAERRWCQTETNISLLWFLWWATISWCLKILTCYFVQEIWFIWSDWRNVSLKEGNVPIEWAFFIALETSFCFLPHKPAEEKVDMNLFIHTTQHTHNSSELLLTCDVSAINSACVRWDELWEQLWRSQTTGNNQ